MAEALRFALYRPHAEIWFRNNLGRILRRDLMPNKYAPFLDYLRRAIEIELIFVSRLDGGLLMRLGDAFQLWFWTYFTGLSGTRIAWMASGVEHAQVLFLMHYGNLTYERQEEANRKLGVAQALGRLQLRKVVHMTHYVYCVDTGAANLNALAPDLLVAESNLADHSAFYRAHFSEVRAPFSCLPYTVSERFQQYKSWAQRSNKMVVTGSITYKMKDPAFCEFFQTQELQPMRRRLLETASSYISEMECLVSDLDSTRNDARPSRLCRVWNLLRRITGARAQGDYYKRDIVEIYNSYTMFAVPEEVCGLPAIGFVEGMACGSAYLGVEGPMYRDLGMVPSVHYIAYDGSIEHLMAQVREHQRDPERTKAVADAGREFVHKTLRADAVYGAFVRSLHDLVSTSELRV